MTNEVRMAKKHTHLKDGMFRLEGGETCQEDHYIDRGLHRHKRRKKNMKENRSKPKTLTTGGKRENNRRIGPEADHFYYCPHKVYWLSRGIASQTEKTDT